MDYDPQSLEAEWRQRWAEAGRYEADPDDGEATFITVPYPYPSGGMHIGHARTYTVPDVYARYRRLQGDNVLFPIAWHVTGTPIIGAVERLKNREQAQLETLQGAFNVPDEDLEQLETPMGYARYFIEDGAASYKTGMRSLGLSIDWRREFTTNDDRYSQFISWQYRTLRDRGLLEKGLHPVNYCTNEQQPVTTHDILEGEDAEFQEFTLIKFSQGEGDERTVFPMATLRPETVRGVTNAYVDPAGSYVRATVDGESWVVSAEAAEKFELQDRDVTVGESLSGADLVGETVANPVTGDEVVVLPADFVDTDNATGVVMSVPAHSPDDYVALQEAKERADEIAAEYGVDADAIRAIEPVPILEIEGSGEIPAADAVAAAGVDSSDDPQLEEVTADLYQDEDVSGKLLDSYGEFAGEVVEDVRERFREHHRDRGNFDLMYEFTEEVVCRCGGDVEVAQQETWFLRYNDEAWQEKARRAVANLECIPENTREQYDHTIGWLEEWPCIRNYGLGTRLPWDDDFVIEPLSDSTIYMSYYTIAHRIQDIPVEDLGHDFFDALFYGADAVEDPDERALELREEFEHWYPVDWRCSGNDLIQNHLTFYLYHHAELFDEPDWPQGITVMGMGLLEGEAMSSSSGHVVLPGEAIDRYGADTTRFFLLNSAEPWQDYDWRGDRVANTRDQLERFWERAGEVIDMDAPEAVDGDDLEHIDYWLLSKLQGTVEETTEALERFETRTASQVAFYGFDDHLKWYRRRANLARPGAKWTLQHVLRTRLRLLAPFVPFMTNELHERLTGEPAEDAVWPAVEDDFDSPEDEVSEQLVRDALADVRDIVDVTGTDPDTVRLYVAADWKRQVFAAARDHEDVGAVMSDVMQDPDLRERGDAVNDLAQEMVEFARERDAETLTALDGVDEADVYRSAAGFLGAEFDADVEVYVEGEDDVVDPENTAEGAEPFRPAIHLV